MLYWKKVREDFWETFCQRFDAGERFDEYEREYMAFDCEKVDEIEGDRGRWTMGMTTVFECDGRTFAIDWNSGLTEYQEDEFYNQPYEVEFQEETITVRKWVSVNKEKTNA